MDAEEQTKPLAFDQWVIPVAVLVACEGMLVSLHDGCKILRTATVAHLTHKLEVARLQREMSLWLETTDLDPDEEGY